MKRGIITAIIAASSGVIFVAAMSGCSGGVEGESYFDLPDGPKTIFRGGYGSIVIRYQPPPEPVFKVDNATRYLDFEELRQKYGMVNEPLVIYYNVKSSVRGASPDLNTLNPAFDDEVIAIVKSWIYSRWGFGKVIIKVEMARSRITVDLSNAHLAEREASTSMPRFGGAKDMVAASGFSKIIFGRI